LTIGFHTLVAAAATETCTGLFDEVLPRLKLLVLAIGVVVEVLVVTLVVSAPLDFELMDMVEFENPPEVEEEEDIINTADDVGLDDVDEDDVLLLVVGSIPPGMQSDPPQESPTGQHAVTPLNTHVG
jgi:hypothetical protein